VYLIGEPKGETYTKLLRFARRHCPEFSLVWRDDVGQNADAEAVRSALLVSLIEERVTTEWPGTKLLAGKALLLRYDFSEAALDVLSAARKLFAWKAPDRPEDPAFYDDHGEVWLGVVAHEGIAFFGPAAPRRNVILSNVPGLKVSSETVGDSSSSVTSNER
jgi:hypothetical protein